MTIRQIAVLALAGALAACEQTEQTLPTGATQDPVTRTITSTGGTVSSAAGAAVSFPAGALAGSHEVTITPVAAPASHPSGTPAAASAFEVTPAGARLAEPATVELKLSSTSDRAWLASVANRLPDGTIQEIGDANVDLGTGIVRAQISRLGTLVAVLPEPSAVITASPLRSASMTSAPASTAAPTATASDGTLRMACGGGPGARCSGVELQVSENLLGSKIGKAALLYPSVGGELVLSGGAVSGTMTVSTAIRLGVAGQGIAADLSLSVEGVSASSYTRTAGSVTLRDVRIVVTQDGDVLSDGLETITIPLSASGATMNVTGAFDFSGTEARVRVAFPVPYIN